MLFNLLSQMAEPANPWDDLPPPLGPDTPSPKCTIKDVDSARATCRLFRDIIDGTPEWACVRLARHDYGKVDKAWENEEDFEVKAFARNWRLFSKSWKLATPIPDDRLRLADVATLSDQDLNDLRNLLDSSSNEEIIAGPDEKLRLSANVWVSPAQRGWFAG